MMGGEGGKEGEKYSKETSPSNVMDHSDRKGIQGLRWFKEYENQLKDQRSSRFVEDL